MAWLSSHPTLAARPRHGPGGAAPAPGGVARMRLDYTQGQPQRQTLFAQGQERITDAFGFSPVPLLARAEELQQAPESVRAASMALKLVRERITLHRRYIAKLIEVAVEEDVPGDWGAIWRRFRAVVESLPRKASLATLEPIRADLSDLRDEVANLLENV